MNDVWIQLPEQQQKPTSIAISAAISGGAGFVLGAGGAAAFTSGALLAGLKTGAIIGALGAVYNLTQKKRVGGGSSRERTEQVSSGTPARWVVGRVRTAGQILYLAEEPDDAKRLHMVIVLSEEAINGCEKVWIDGIEVPINGLTDPENNPAGDTPRGSPIRPVPGNRYDGHFEAELSFNAQGSNETSMGEIFGDWEASDKLEGLSYAHVVLTQNDDRNDPFYRNIPKIEFLLQGIKIRTPTSQHSESDPQWTQDWSDVRYWWMRQRRGITQAAINYDSWTSSRLVTSSRITRTLPAGYESYNTTIDRYTINGIFASGDDVTDVEDLMDFAAQGHVVDYGGQWHFLPGATRVASFNIRDADVKRLGRTTIAPPIQSRFNVFTARIAQARTSDWKEEEIPAYWDRAAIRRDRQGRTADFGLLPYTIDPVHALWLVTVGARRARKSRIWNVALMPGANLWTTSILPGQWGLFSNSELGVFNQDVEVLDTKIQPDMSVVVTLQEADPSFYDPRLEIPSPAVFAWVTSHQPGYGTTHLRNTATSYLINISIRDSGALRPTNADGQLIQTAPGHVLQEMAYDPVSQKTYGWLKIYTSTGVSGNYLVEINLDTGDLTRVGSGNLSLPDIVNVTGFHIDRSGNGFITTSGSNNVIDVDLATGGTDGNISQAGPSATANRIGNNANLNKFGIGVFGMFEMYDHASRSNKLVILSKVAADVDNDIYDLKVFVSGKNIATGEPPVMREVSLNIDGYPASNDIKPRGAFTVGGKVFVYLDRSLYQALRLGSRGLELALISLYRSQDYAELDKNPGYGARYSPQKFSGIATEPDKISQQLLTPLAPNESNLLVGGSQALYAVNTATGGAERLTTGTSDYSNLFAVSRGSIYRYHNDTINTSTKYNLVERITLSDIAQDGQKWVLIGFEPATLTDLTAAREQGNLRIWAVTSSLLWNEFNTRNAITRTESDGSRYEVLAATTGGTALGTPSNLGGEWVGIELIGATLYVLGRHGTTHYLKAVNKDSGASVPLPFSSNIGAFATNGTAHGLTVFKNMLATLVRVGTDIQIWTINPATGIKQRIASGPSLFGQSGVANTAFSSITFLPFGQEPVLQGPPPPTSFTATSLPDGTRRYEWTPPADTPDYRGVHIRYAFDDSVSWIEMTELTSGLLTFTPFETQLPLSSASITFECRSVDAYGTESDTGIRTRVDTLGPSPTATVGNWLGDWTSGTAYVLRDLVRDAGVVYVCIKGHTASNANKPTDPLTAANNTLWEIYIEAGLDGEDGEDGAGFEFVYTAYRSRTLPASRRPSNTWGFDRPGTRGGQRWFDGAPTNLSATNRFMFRSERRVSGTPARGTSISDSWTVPAVIGAWGDRGETGEDGAGTEWIFCVVRANQTSVVNGVRRLQASSNPVNSWTFDRPGSVGGVTWTDAAGETTASSPYRFISERRVPGTPTVNTRPSGTGNWTTPVLHYEDPRAIISRTGACIKMGDNQICIGNATVAGDGTGPTSGDIYRRNITGTASVNVTFSTAFSGTPTLNLLFSDPVNGVTITNLSSTGFTMTVDKSKHVAAFVAGRNREDDVIRYRFTGYFTEWTAIGPG